MLFRVATYNVHKCKGMDWRVSAARIADVMSHLESDILATQEILQSQAEEISSRIGMKYIFGPARQHAAEPYGNAVFSRFQITCHENYDLTVSGRERRQCLRVSVLLPECGDMHFFAVHLGTSFSERRHQARWLVSPRILQSNQYNRRRILVGDFNEWTRGLATQLLSEHMRSADVTMHLKRGTTYPGMVPFMHLDHIYYDPDFELREMHLYRTRLSLIASDHLPLAGTFSI